MHYTTYGVILAAGSNVVSAGLRSREAVPAPVFLGGPGLGLALPGLGKGKSSKVPVRPPPGGKPKEPTKPKDTPAPADPPLDPKYKAQADQMAQVATEYQREYKRLNPKDLGNNTPPMPNFNLGTTNNYAGPVTNNNDNSMNDYRTQIGNGATVNGGIQNNNSKTGPTTNNNQQIDKSMNDNRVQVGNGANAAGLVANNQRNGASNSKSKRDLDDPWTANEDGRVTPKDFFRLVKVMKKNSNLKNEALYEFAGIPGLRPIVEGLISTHTDTDGQLTMNNFAALVNAMSEDQAVAQAVVDAFNSNMVWAFIVEKILTKDSKIKQKELARRYIIESYEHYSGLNARDVDEMDDFLVRRDASDEDFWLDARDATPQAQAAPKDSTKELGQLKAALEQFISTQGVGCNPCQISADKGDVMINWMNRGGPGILQVKLVTNKVGKFDAAKKI